MYRYIIIHVAVSLELALLINFVIFASSGEDGPVCFQCTKLNDPYACNVLARCGAHEKCFSAYSFFGDPLDTLLWDVGCTNGSSCKVVKRSFETPSSGETNHNTGIHLKDLGSHRGSPVNVGVRDLDNSGEKFSACGECCDGDYCNEIPCQHQDAQKNIPTGLVCHSCQDVDNSSKCLEVKRCQKGEICAAWITTKGLLSMGCKNAAICSSEKNGTPQRTRRNVDKILSQSADRSRSKLFESGRTATESDVDISSTNTNIDEDYLNAIWSHVHNSYFSAYARRSASKASNDIGCSECCNTSYCAADLCANFLVPPLTPSTISVELSPATVTAVEGSNVTFVCNITGPPPLNITFSLLSQSINVSSEIKTCNVILNSAEGDVVCILESVSFSNAGLLTCDVTSSVLAATESATANVLVEKRAVTLNAVITPRDTIIGGRGFTNVTCKVDGYPNPRYRWYQNSSGSRIDIKSLPSFNVVSGPNDSSLLQVDSSSRQDGNFLCEASNVHETITLPFKLKSATNITLTKAPSNVNIDSKSSPSHLTFSCSFDSYPAAHVSWSLSSTSNKSLNFVLDHYRGVNITSSTKDTSVTSVITIPTTLILQNQTPDVVKCAGDNGYHSLRTSAFVRFLAAPTITTPAGSKEFDVMKGNDVTLRCDADGNPKPLLAWIFADKYGNPSILGGVSILDSGKTLKVVDMRVDGTFTCRARNSQGNDEVSIKINIIT